MPKIANRVAQAETTIFTEINDFAAQFDTVNLGQGKPDFDTPAPIISAMVDAAQSGSANQYAPGYGILPLRQQIARHAADQYGLPVDPDAGVVVTAGASEGVFTAIMAVVNPSDEVILLEPYFDIYLPAIEWAGGKPVYVPMHPPQWTFDPDALRQAFTPKTRAIMINSPHNPTGRVFTPDELTLIADLCKEHDVIAISDEVYEHLTYGDAQHIPIASLPEMFERTITVSSGAKTFSATGWKVGWVYGARELVTGVWRIHQNVTFAVHHPAQYGIAHGLSLGQAYFDEFKAMYTHKRQILLDGLLGVGIKVDYTPDGAFYIMGDFSDVYDGNDHDFAKWLIQEIGVASIPPSAFFSAEHQHITSKHVRFSYCKRDDVLHEAVARLAQLQT
jgi:N-succinyldiaminopimelate aminotransferase